MTFTTPDLYDAHENDAQVAEPIFRSYGGAPKFSGIIATLKLHEDNSLVRAALETAGEGRVLVIDGGGSLRCALVGDQLAVLAIKNGWKGIIVNGCIRDSVAIGRMQIGIKALNTHPRKSVKKGAGDRDIAVSFAGIAFRPGHHVYSDEDGILVAANPLI
jgi:regulator of ribonuclease activity A